MPEYYPILAGILFISSFVLYIICVNKENYMEATWFFVCAYFVFWVAIPILMRILPA